MKAENGNKWVYKITTSVVLEMTIEKKETGNFNVCGSLTKTVYPLFIKYIRKKTHK